MAREPVGVATEVPAAKQGGRSGSFSTIFGDEVSSSEVSFEVSVVESPSDELLRVSGGPWLLAPHTPSSAVAHTAPSSRKLVNRVQFTIVPCTARWRLQPVCQVHIFAICSVKSKLCQRSLRGGTCRQARIASYLRS